MLISIIFSLAVTACVSSPAAPNEPEDDESEPIYLVKDEASEYSIAFGNTDAVRRFGDYAVKLRGRIASEYFPFLDKYDASEENRENEFLIGDTDRQLSLDLKAAVTDAAAPDGDLVWGYAYRDGKLAFYASSDEALKLGWEEFEKAIYKKDGIAVSEDLWVIGIKDRKEYEAELRGEVNLVLNADSKLTDLHLQASEGMTGTVKGKLQSYVLTLPKKIVMTGDLSVSRVTLSGDCTIIANGYKLEIASDVLMTEGRLTVYGGTESGTLEGDTELVLLGARYEDIFGGGNGTAVNGNTNIILGGNANSGEGIDDDKSNISTCLLYAGGRGGAVNGSTNVTLKDNAVTKYIIGCGMGAEGAKVGSTNIKIQGGKVMNLIGASFDSPTTDITVNITVLGGLIESIFGTSKPMTGNVNVYLLGGDVSRRVYAGCYNGYSSGFDSEHYVTGRVTVTIGKDVRLNSGKELSSSNSSDKGVYVSSRRSGRAQGEIGTVIFLDGSYQTQKSKIGSQSWLFSICESYHLYEIICSEGGEVVPYGNGQNLAVLPGSGYKCTLNGKEYLHTSDISTNIYTLPTASSLTTVNVVFTKQ